jgi:diguanylate cyclase
MSMRVRGIPTKIHTQRDKLGVVHKNCPALSRATSSPAQVLRLVATAVRQNVKGQDLAARYGGEEFAVILPNAALRQALTVADHIRRGVVLKELIKRSTGECLGRITISIGVATLHKAEAAPALIERADACLYAAKRNGRNCIVAETDLDSMSTCATQVA